mgnify:CR=1 FL=1|jgi:hypothetical protein
MSMIQQMELKRLKVVLLYQNLKKIYLEAELNAKEVE